MRTPKNISWLKLVLPVVVVGGFGIQVVGQTPPSAPAPSPIVRKKPTVSRVIVQNKSAAPQVVTILHTLNGLKVLGILIGKEDVEAIARLDQSFHLSGEVHTNVIAGLALDDGKTIAAWLPEAEAEMPPRMFTFTPRGPVGIRVPGTPPTIGQPAPPSPPMAEDLPGVPSITLPSFPEPADLRVITRDGKRIMGHYIGLDGLTGLSLIKLTNGSMAQTVDSKEETIVVGQQVRVIGPQPAQGPAKAPETGLGSRMYIRIGETEAIVVNVSRSPSGGIARVKIKSAKFSPANIGGIAINDQGETLGIIDTVQGETASIVPVALVRMAAKRVMARNASVPRPWLGIRGEPIGAMKLDKIQRIGWEVERARALAEKGQGILLTSIVPGSPAALAQLKPGDVILSVNKGNIRNAEEFSWLLDEASPESPTLFTVARPGKEAFESMEIQLGESPDLFLGLKKIPERIPRAFTRIAEGVVTVPLKPKVALNFGSVGGLLVVSVRPSTDAFMAGLRAGDVIESIDGRPVYAGSYTAMLPRVPGARTSCVVVRNKEKITLTFEYSTHHDSPKP